MSDYDHTFAETPGGQSETHDQIIEAIGPHLRAMNQLGIIHCPPAGPIDIRESGAVIGVLVLIPNGERNLVKIIPRIGITLYQHTDLEIQAQHALTHGPVPGDCWRYHEHLACHFTEVVQPD